MSTPRLNQLDFESTLRKHPAEVQELARGARRLILELLPEAFEVVWTHQGITGYGTGPKKMTEHFCWIGPQKAYCQLGFYYGSELDDPAMLLEGTGARMRHVKLRTPADLARPELRDLLARSLHHRVPPPRPL